MFPSPVEFVEESLDNAWATLGAKNELYILVRPDNYIANISDNFDAQEIREYLGEFFILPQ